MQSSAIYLRIIRCVVYTKWHVIYVKEIMDYSKAQNLQV